MLLILLIIFFKFLAIGHSIQSNLVDLSKSENQLNHHGQVIFKYDFSQLIEPSQKLTFTYTGLKSTDYSIFVDQIFYLFKDLDKDGLQSAINMNLSFSEIHKSKFNYLDPFAERDRHFKNQTKNYKIIANKIENYISNYNIYTNIPFNESIKMEDNFFNFLKKGCNNAKKMEEIYFNNHTNTYGNAETIVTKIYSVNNATVYRVGTNSSKCSDIITKFSSLFFNNEAHKSPFFRMDVPVLKIERVDLESSFAEVSSEITVNFEYAALDKDYYLLGYKIITYSSFAIIIIWVFFRFFKSIRKCFKSDL